MVIERFDVFRNAGSSTYPWLVVVQHEILAMLPTRLVVPLIRRSRFEGQPITRLNPIFVLERSPVILMTQQMGAVRVSTLSKRVGSLAEHGSLILGAIDVLLSGV